MRVRSLVAVMGLLIQVLLGANVLGQEPTNYFSPDSSRQGQLGFTVSFDGNMAFAGAPGQVSRPGRGFLFDLENGSSTEVLPSGQRPDGLFGFTSQLEGDRLIVGDPGNPFISSPPKGAVYLYDVSSGQELSRFEAPQAFGGDEFGFGVNMHGNLAAIGAPNLGVGEGAAYLYDIDSGTQLHRFSASDALAGSEFGADVAVNEKYVVVGAPANFETLGFFPGATYVYDVATGNELHKLVPNDSTGGNEFGFDMDVSGDLAIIGAPSGGSDIGSAYLFDLSTGQQLFKLTPDDNVAGNDFGATVAIDGNLIAVGASGLRKLPGAVYLFDASTGAQLDKLAPADMEISDAFGLSVALRGARLLAGSPLDDSLDLNEGSAYLYEIDPDLTVRRGDFDRSGALDVADIDLLTAGVVSGVGPAEFDLDGDGQFDNGDREVWVNELAGTYFGDANLDGEVNTRDLVVVLQGGQYEDTIAGNSTWGTGDFNGDLEFTTSDLVAALQTGAYEQGPRMGTMAAVPEPSSGVLLLSGLLLVRRFRGF